MTSTDVERPVRTADGVEMRRWLMPDVNDRPSMTGRLRISARGGPGPDFLSDDAGTIGGPSGKRALVTALTAGSASRPRRPAAEGALVTVNGGGQDGARVLRRRPLSSLLQRSETVDEVASMIDHVCSKREFAPAARPRADGGVVRAIA